MTSHMKPPPTAAAASPTNSAEGEKQRSINAELWHACAGPLVSLPQAGTLVVYFPQGHLEQIAASMHRDADSPLPNYPNLPSKLVCRLHNVTLHADAETDEVYAQMTLQPVSTYNKDALLATELAGRSARPQPEFFCKTLTASDTSTHGGFSVPRRAAEKIFPPLDFSLQPPAQELQARDLHDNLWTFRHIYRGQPKRHLLTTGWSLFVSGKRLFAGDSVLFIRDAKSQLLLGIRRANRQPTNMPSSVLSSDSMHIGVLAAAAHAAANNGPFTVFYNPRASPSEFVIPLTKYNKAIYSNQLSLGMRFRMMFETEDSGTRRYMGTITGISDLDPVRWKSSQWRNLQVGWDESAAGERRNRVSIWEIEPVVAPFFICPPPFFRSKRPRQPGVPDDESDMENLIKRAMPWLGEEVCIKDSQTQNAIMPGLSLAQWMSMQQNLSFGSSSSQPDYLRSLTGPVPQNLGVTDLSRQLNLQAQIMQQNNVQFNTPKPPQQIPQIDQLSKLQAPSNQLGAIVKQPQQQLQDINMLQKQIGAVTQSMPLSQNQSNLIQPPVLAQNQTHQQQSQQQQPQQQQPLIHSSPQPSQISVLSNQMQLPLQQQQQQILLQQQQQLLQQQQQQHQHQNQAPVQSSQQVNQQTQLSEQQIQLQLLQKLQLQQQALLQQAIPQHPQSQPVQEQPKAIISTPQNFPNAQLLSQRHTPPVQFYTGAAATAAAELQFSQPLTQQIQMQQLPSSELHSVVLPPPVNLQPVSSSPLQGIAAQSLDANVLSSCSVPPLAKVSDALPQQLVAIKAQQNGPVKADDVAHSVLNPSNLDALATGLKTPKESMKPGDRVKHSVVIPKAQNVGTAVEVAAQQPYTGRAATQTGFMDSSSSATSACISQDSGKFQPSFPLLTFNQESVLFRDNPLDGEVQAVDPRNNVLFGVNIDGPLELPLTTDVLIDKNISPMKDFQNNLPSADMVAIASKEAQQEISSSIVSQSFGDPPFNSMDSNINENGFLNKWAPPSQVQRLRTYTKVYKRGAVGRSIDISRYSGYDELKRDLARMFSIEGQLEDRHKIGWKFVYVDHENDVLLVGDDPWEEFVSCVKCIRILSPQEVQQMSLEGEFGNNVLPNQNSSSSDGGNAWRGQCDQISGNPSAGSYDRFE